MKTVFIIYDELIDENEKKTEVSVSKVFAHEDTAVSYLNTKTTEEDFRYTKGVICMECFADFDDKYTPNCYTCTSEVDPACENYETAYPRHNYVMVEMVVEDYE